MERELQNESQKPETTESLARPWVLLVRQNREGQTVFAQSGPFTTTEVLEKVRAGEANFSDHVWKAGFERWVKIQELTDFQEAPPAVPNVEDRAAEASEILSKVLQQIDSRPDIVAADEAVPEAGSADLTQVQPLLSEKPTEDPAPVSRKVEFPFETARPELIEEKTVSDSVPSEEPQLPQPRREILRQAVLRNRNPLIFAAAGVAALAIWWNWPSSSAEKSATPPEIPSAESAPPAPTETTPNATINDTATTAPLEASLPSPPETGTVQAPVDKAPASVEPAPVAPARVADMKPRKPKAQVQKEKKVLVDSSRSLQKKARSLETQFQSLKGQPKAWASFYQQWRQDMTSPAQLELRGLAKKRVKDLAFPDEVRELSRSRESLLSRAQLLDRGIRAGRVKNLARSGDLEKRFQSLNRKAAQL